MASQVMVTGLSAYRAYEVAETIETRLLDEGRLSISSQELLVALDTLRDLAGERYATNFRRWQDVAGPERAARDLIGGAVGVGKSTIATHLAHRLGIVRVVATDGSIREVMRAMLSEELMPALHVSSFQADKAVREPRADRTRWSGVPRADPGGVGGIEATIQRSVTRERAS